MALTAGTKLGQYEVREMIGAGGMGEVYRATDAKLKRDVALKLLPEQFARDPERLARFKREAQMLASLNHPNIATIHGLEEASGAHFLVMELVPGETLQERVRRDGAVPLDEALDIAKQICEALEHAHEKPIIHRDLKPANVKRTPEGKVKVLDFGLAKAFAEDGAAGDTPKPVYDSNSPTVSRLPEQQTPEFSPTIPGTIMGTAAYMSPEQARGKTVDKRTDIWALGCVLYELLTGEGAFYRDPSLNPSPDRKRGANQSRARQQAGAGVERAKEPPLPHGRGSDQNDEPDTVQDILARVLHAEPDWSRLPANTPPGIRALLRRCLTKEAAQRLRDAGDIKLAIEDIFTAPITAQAAMPAPPSPSKSPWKRRLIFSAVGLAAWAVTAYVIWNMKPVTPPQPVTRTVLQLGPGERFFVPSVLPFAISPDGRRMVYFASRGVQSAQLFVRALDTTESRVISPTGGDAPFFSPDGERVGFFDGTVLKMVPIGGGVLTALANIGASRGGNWGDDNQIIFPPASASGLMRVPAPGGKPEPVTKLGKGEFAHKWPELLPGGKALLFVSSTSTVFFDDAQILAQRLDTGERKLVVQGGTYPHYLPTGHLVYYRAGTIMAVPFDATRLEVRGTPVPVLDGVASRATDGSAEFSISNNGTLLYMEGSPLVNQTTLVQVDRHGAGVPLRAPPHGYGGVSGPKLSRDGKSIVVMVQEQNSDAWIYDLTRDTLTRLTFDGTLSNISWTPDGKRIVFTSTKTGSQAIMWKPADGSGPDDFLVKSDRQVFTGSFTPDGRVYLYGQNSPDTTGRDIFYESVDDRKPHVFLQTSANETAPRVSPDGRYVAYVSDESGRNEIYVQPFPGPGGKYQISTEGGKEVVWAANGEIFYRNGTKMMAVQVETQPTLQIGKPQLLFDEPYVANTGNGALYDATADGQHFIMLKAPEQSSANQINVVLNWFEELKAKVPVN
jgi:serine/threonine protein kinase